nr:hypothetical protein [uncultured Deefgea sp.]
MNIDEISEYVWLNSKEIKFGELDTWDVTLFTTEWANSNCDAWRNIGAGWYWFSVDMNYDELHSVEKPSSLPEKGCDIGLLCHANRAVFGTELLCTTESGTRVIYNGHEANVKSRIRAHFALNNNSTGALGIKHYPLSSKRWIVRYFSETCFTNELDESDKSRIQYLMNSSSGRCAVESAWRVKYGWPVLCKE